MNTTLLQQLAAGDVIEVTTIDGDAMTVLVLLATDDFVVLDPCDDSTPFVIKNSELTEYRKFDVDQLSMDLLNDA